MYKESAAKIVTTIKRRVSHWRFLLMNKLDKDQVLDALSKADFYLEILRNVENRDYSCQGLANAYGKVSRHIFRDLEDDFLSNVYQYVLSKSFPEAVTVAIDGDHRIYEFYLVMLVVVNNFQKESDDETFMSIYPFDLLTKKEVLDLEDQTEYIKFQDAFRNQYIYEMMKLNYEDIWSFNNRAYIRCSLFGYQNC